MRDHALLRRLTAWRKPLTAVGLALGLGLFGWQLWQSFLDARSLGWSMVAHGDALAVAFLGSLLVYVAQMIAWQFTLRYLGSDLGLSEIVEGFQLSFLPRYIPGSIWGYFSRSQWLKGTHGVPYATSMLGSGLEMAAQALTAFIAGFACLALAREGAARPLFAGLAAVALVLTYAAVPPLIPRLARRLAPDRPFPTRSAGLWRRAVTANLALRACYGLSFWGVIRAVAPASAAGMADAQAASNLSWLVGFIIPIVPTGIGVREWTLARLLTDGGLLTAAQANLAAVLFRFAIIATELLWLVVGLALYARRWRSRAGADRLEGREDEE